MAKARTTGLSAGIRGRVGDVVYVQGPNGTIVRSLPRRRARPTRVQLQGEARVAAVGARWAALEPAAMVRWRDYAASLDATTPTTERTLSTGYQAFFALANRLLQIDPAATVPSEPPTNFFAGDALSIKLSSSPEGVVFEAGRPNAPGVITELLLQPLANGGRLPIATPYRSQGFAALGASPATVPAAPGWFAGAVRFVEGYTGRATALLPCGVVRVE